MGTSRGHGVAMLLSLTLGIDCSIRNKHGAQKTRHKDIIKTSSPLDASAKLPKEGCPKPQEVGQVIHRDPRQVMSMPIQKFWVLKYGKNGWYPWGMYHLV